MISEDKYMELLVAGINELSMPDANIQHDVVIGGRQFDVIAEVYTGQHRIMLAYEVKNKKRRVSVDLIDAFVTKFRDAKADKAVFVSTSGFQSGCYKVADSHNIDLFQLEFPNTVYPPELGAYALFSKDPQAFDISSPIFELGDPTLIPQVTQVRLLYADGKRFMVPDEPSQMQYYMEKTRVLPNFSLHTLVGKKVPNIISESKTITKSIQPHTGNFFRVVPPDDFFFPSGNVKKIEFDCVGSIARPALGNTVIEPSSFSRPVVYKNVKSGEKVESKISHIPVGPPTLVVGKFYFEYFPLRYIYCDDIQKNTATIYLVESFQMGSLCQAVLQQDLKYSRFYLPVEDKKTVSRLEKRLSLMKKGY